MATTTNTPKAIFKGIYQGRRVSLVPVRILVNDPAGRDFTPSVDVTLSILSRGPDEAADWFRDRLAHIPFTEITAYGPKGGEYHRYIGARSAIAAGLGLGLCNCVHEDEDECLTWLENEITKEEER